MKSEEKTNLESLNKANAVGTLHEEKNALRKVSLAFMVYEILVLSMRVLDPVSVGWWYCLSLSLSC